MKTLLATLTASALIAGTTATGAPVIYESFSQTEGALNGKAASTTGLTGNWSQDQTVNVVTPPTLTYGDLDNAGGQVNLSNGNGTDAWVSTSAALADADLLDDGATLWFSYVYKKTSHGGSNEHSGFALTSERFTTGASGPALNATGYGFGAYNQNGSLQALSYSNSTTRSTAGSINAQDLQDSTPLTPANDKFGETLVIGKMQWNADSGENDTLTIWTRALDDIDTEPTTGGSTQSALILQGQLDTITFASRNSGGTQSYDEIRFGATFADVTPVPEPGSLALLGLGSLLIGYRRRRD